MITGIWKSRVIDFSFAKYNTKLNFRLIAAITDTGVQLSIFDIVTSTYVYAYVHICLRISIFVVNFDALAQASDIQIERRQVVFLC